jgi:hypothetical protein
VVASRKALEDWLSKYSMQSMLSQNQISNGVIKDQRTSPDAEQMTIPIEDILCEHGGLDYRKTAQMKVITQVCRSTIMIVSYTLD